MPREGRLLQPAMSFFYHPHLTDNLPLPLLYLPQSKTAKDNKVIFTVWHGARKHVACLRTVKSMVANMITGVTRGFQYKMRLVYAHFPINPIITDGKSVEIRNFCEWGGWRCDDLKDVESYKLMTRNKSQKQWVRRLSESAQCSRVFPSLKVPRMSSSFLETTSRTFLNPLHLSLTGVVSRRRM
jgi:hypothetical protein